MNRPTDRPEINHFSVNTIQPFLHPLITVLSPTHIFQQRPHVDIHLPPRRQHTVVRELSDAVRVVDDLIRPPTPAADPHTRIEERVSFVTGFQLDVDAEFIRGGRGGVRHVGVGEFLEGFLGSRAPAERADGDVGGWVVGGLEEVRCVDACGEVFEHELVVLSSGDDDAFAPAAGPLAADEGDPVAVAEHGGADGDFGVEFDGHAEIEFEGGAGDGEGAGDVVFVEAVEEVVGGDGVFHDVHVGGAFEEMLALAGGVFGADLVAVDALHREAFVFFFGAEFDESGVHVVEGWGWEVAPWCVVLGSGFGFGGGSWDRGDVGLGCEVGGHAAGERGAAGHLHRCALWCHAVCHAVSAVETLRAVA